MPRAVQFDHYGEIEVLQVVEVDRPRAGPGQLLVRVKAAGINPGEAAIRKGVFAEHWPTTFPCGQGSDLAGIVEELGDGVENVAVGDQLIGFTNRRASQAEYVVIEANDFTLRPSHVSWEVAGSLFVAGTTAYAAIRAVSLRQGDTVVISGAAGGVGSIAVQLARLAGARVLGLASPVHHQWLSDHGVIPLAYSDSVVDSLRKASGDRLDAFIDTFGADYVECALELGIQPERINTISNFEAAARYGVRTEGNAQGASAEILAELAGLIDQGNLDIPIAGVYPLAAVREAYRELERRHILGFAHRWNRKLE